MNAYVITRETSFVYDSKVVFDKRNLEEDTEAVKVIGKELWPADPLEPQNYDIEYYAQVIPVSDIMLSFELYQCKDCGDMWFWKTHWTAYDYNSNLLESIYEQGYKDDYMSALNEAFESYQKAREE